jgi:hypothetical protein
VVSAFGGFDAAEGFFGAAVGLLGPGQGCVRAYADGLIAGVCSRGLLSFGVGHCRGRGPVERGLLIVEYVSAQVLGSLAVIKLHLVRVAAILGETQFGLSLLEEGLSAGVVLVGGGSINIESFLGAVDTLLVAVRAGLFAFGDALIEVDHRLFLVEFALLART